MTANPDLLQPGANAPSVPKLTAITEPMANTVVEPVYFFCTMEIASFHRKDGKKLPFINHILKCNIQEDIDYLNSEIRSGNPYVRRATAEEVDHAKLLEDPMGAVRDAVKKDVVNNFTVEELEKMLAERRATTANSVSRPEAGSDASKIGGVDKLNNLARSVLKAQDVRPAGGSVGGTNSATIAAAAAASMRK